MAASFIAGAAASTGNSQTDTTTGVNTTGATLLIAVLVFYSGSPTFTDSNGNTWVPLTKYGATGGNNDYCQIFYSYAKGGGALVVGAGHTVTISATSYASIAFAAFAGTLTTSSIYEAGSDTGATAATGTTLAPSASKSPAAAGDLVISGYADGSQTSGGTLSINQSFTIATSNFNGYDTDPGLAYLIAPSTSGVQPTWSYTKAAGLTVALAIFAQATGTTISVTDSGSGADSMHSIANALSTTDTGYSTDAIGSIANALSASDTGHGVDALGSIANALSTTDTGHGTDSMSSIVVTLSVVDNSSGADALSSLAAALGIIDASSGVDILQSIAATLGLTDISSAVDSISGVGVTLGVVDTSSGVDSIGSLGSALTITDISTGNDSAAPTVTVTLQVADTGNAADLVSTVQTFLVSVADACAASDNLSVAVTLNLSDSGQGLDFVSAISAIMQVVDSCQGVDIVIKTGPPSLTYRAVTILFKSRRPSVEIATRAPVITFKARKPSISFKARRAAITFTSRKPNITFQGVAA